MKKIEFLQKLAERGYTRDEAKAALDTWRSQGRSFDDDAAVAPQTQASRAAPKTVSSMDAFNAGMDAVGREVAPLASATMESNLPAIAKYPIAVGATALDIVSSPFRLADKAANIVTLGSYDRAMQYIDERLSTGNNFTDMPKNLVNLGAKMAVSPSSLFGYGAARAAFTSSGKQAAKQMENEMTRGVQAAANNLKNENGMVAMSPKAINEIDLKDIQKGTDVLIEQPSGEIVSVGKYSKQGIPFFRDLDEVENRILAEPKAPKTISFDEYSKQAAIKGKQYRAEDANQLAGMNATKAFKEVDKIKRQAGEEIDRVIQENKGVKISIANIKNNYLQMVDERIGELKTGSIPADNQAMKEAEDLGNYLLGLPDELNARDAVNLKRNLQSRVKYTQEGQYKIPNSIIDGIVKKTSADIDQSLDIALPGFKNANESYSEVAQLSQRMSKILGTEINSESGLTKHGSSIMKRALESNADSGISEIFRQVKKLTNGEYDLFQDAAYAQIAMKYSGDARQARKAMAGLPIQDAIPQGGTLSAKTIDATVKTGKAAREKITGGKLSRIQKWYTENQKKYSTLGKAR